jgi:23S rRNA (adenine2030-N6)-methyltransferase
MLSYRHAFHAGNHADVLKHTVLVQLLAYLAQKDKPFWVIDTHAGAGCYALDSEHASKLAEYEDGVGRLWGRQDLPPALSDYLALVYRLNGNSDGSGKLLRYPGSPWLAWQCLRPEDRLRLFELHSSDVKPLQQTFREAGRQVGVVAGDGFAGLKALLPPPSRRGLVLIDPSYELHQDYQAVPEALKDALKRFAGGTYAIWYPQLSRLESRQLPDKLKKLPCSSWLHVALTVRKPARDGFGMHGSGMFVINPPWTLHDTLKATMPPLVERLGLDEGAHFTLEYEENATSQPGADKPASAAHPPRAPRPPIAGKRRPVR